jgi:hypothetical protein
MQNPRRRALALSSIVAVGLALALAGPASAAGGLKAIWGPLDLPNGQSAFPYYKDLGVQVFQYQLLWASAAPTKPTVAVNPGDAAYHWPPGIQDAIDRAGANGIQVALLVRQTPSWANNGAGGTVAPSNVQDYADFLTAARQKYPSVNRWMIWGEANRTAQWSSGPTAYADLLDAAYGALKATSLQDPGDNTVVGGMSFTYGETAPAQWIDQLRRSNGSRPRLDEYGHNPFSRRCPDLSQGPNYLRDGALDMSDIDTLREDVRAAFGAYKPLWLSEFTVSSDHANRAFTFYVSRNEQADWLARAFRIAGNVPGVSGLGWFNLYDEPGSSGLTTGLLDANLAPKPAYAVYKSGTLDDTGPPGPCPSSGDSSNPGSPGTTSPPPTGASPLVVRLTAPHKLRVRALLRRLRFGVTSSSAGTAVSALFVDAGTARRTRLSRRARHPVRVARSSVAVAAGPNAITLHLSRAARRKLRRVNRGRLSLTVVVRDAAGDSVSKSAQIRLTR